MHASEVEIEDKKCEYLFRQQWFNIDRRAHLPQRHPHLPEMYTNSYTRTVQYSDSSRALHFTSLLMYARMHRCCFDGTVFAALPGLRCEDALYSAPSRIARVLAETSLPPARTCLDPSALSPGCLCSDNPARVSRQGPFFFLFFALKGRCRQGAKSRAVFKTDLRRATEPRPGTV
jgi:hypothetical protein